MAATNAERQRKHRVKNGNSIPDLTALLEKADGLPDPPERAKLLKLLGAVALQGNVPAIRLLLEEYRRDGDHDKAAEFESSIDELAARRAG